MYLSKQADDVQFNPRVKNQSYTSSTFNKDLKVKAKKCILILILGWIRLKILPPELFFLDEG